MRDVHMHGIHTHERITNTQVYHLHSTCMGTEQSKRSLLYSLCSFKAMGHCLWECHLPEHFMTLSVDLISPRDETERENSSLY